MESALAATDFNKRRRFVIVGNAADDELVGAVDYWKRCGLSVAFLPYRVYLIGADHYFEFFALPYDRHRNPSSVKGVLFDTNSTWKPDAGW